MADTVVDVGFNTDELKAAVSGIGGGGGGAQDQKNNIAGGFTTALKATGVVALLASLKVVLDTISFVLNFISSLISFLLVKMIQSVFKFFDDPVRGLLELGVFIVNAIIENINNVVKAINLLIPGTKGDIPLIPELDPEEVLRLYDEAKEAARLLSEGMMDAANNLEIAVIDGATVLEEKVNNSFKAYSDVLNKIINEGEKFVSGRSSNISRTGGSTFENLQNFASRQSRDPIVEAKRQDANRAFKYLTTGG